MCRLIGVGRGASLSTLPGTYTQHSVATVQHRTDPTVVVAPGAGALAEPLHRAAAR